MASHLSWIDFSENDRRTMLNIISMFSGKETLDELGIGSVRDAFADRFFPGTSTTHTTRAKYSSDSTSRLFALLECSARQS